MKLFVLPPKEDWICDRFVSEWNAGHDEMTQIHKTVKETVVKKGEFESVSSPKMADVVWLLAGWCWRHVDPQTLSKKKVIASLHHIVPEKFGDAALQEFKMRDQFVDAYHVPCEKTKEQIEDLTDKPIFCFPFWVNQNIWYHKDKKELRKKYNIPENAFLIGSFQRDTEGRDLVSPKLEKGPDIFCDIVEALHKIEPNVQVLLAAWRRQYVMKRLNKAGITFFYQELPDFPVLNDFYNMLDLYIVGSRYEGGPQAVFECAATKTPIISTSVGYAPELLHHDCLIENKATWRKASREDVIKQNFEEVEKIFIPNGFNKFEEMIRKVGNGKII